MDERRTAPADGPMIAFACAACGRKLSVKAEFAGRSTRCPTCKQPLVVPAAFERTVTMAASHPDATRAVADAQPTVDQPAGPAGAPAQDPLAARVGERYAVGAELARGGMGAVLQATDRDIRREVAVKYLLDQADPQKKQRFVQEAQITGQLEHPNIVPIHELGIDAGGRVFFAMKMVRGRSLAQVLDGRGAPSADQDATLPRLLSAFVGICNALAYAHARGVVHRDVKPANIMLGDFGEVYVMDWGLAKVLDGAGTGAVVATAAAPAATDSDPQAVAVAEAYRGPDQVVTSREAGPDLTQDGSILGTPTYMAPEQAAGRTQAIDERSDVYALGAILYEILTRQPPVSRQGGYPAILKRVIDGQVVPPAQLSPERARAGLIPPELAAIAMKALALAPRDRYQSVEFLRRDVERFLDGRSVSAKEDSRKEMLVRFVKRNRAFSAVSAAAVVVLTVVITWGLAVNLQARREAEAAYRAYEAEQKEKEARTREIVPALIKLAQLGVEQRHFDAALDQLKLALEYDPGNLDGRLLQARLLVAKQEFPAAAALLGKYLEQRPRDAQARELHTLCAAVHLQDEDKSDVVQIAQALVWQGFPTLAESLLQQHGGDAVREELLGLYRARLAAAWPKQSERPENTSNHRLLWLDADGYHLKIRAKDVRDLAPLKGMALYSVALDCPELRDVSALHATPLKAFTLENNHVADLRPLKGLALTAFRASNCRGLSDFAFLEGMPLTALTVENCSCTPAQALLRGMPLASVRLGGCPGLTDVSGLDGAPLKTLAIFNCGVRDFNPLRRSPLTTLFVQECNIQDLSPLQGMPLTQLDLADCREVSDLTPLRGLPLTRLSLLRCLRVKDLAPLQGLRLKSLDLTQCKAVEDVTPLRGMPLTYAGLGGTAIKNVAVIKGMPLTEIRLAGCVALTDLSALQGMALAELDLSGCDRLANLGPLQGMPLNSLSLANCREIADLKPLRGMPLNRLQLSNCDKVTDLTPLADAVLVTLDLAGCVGLQDLAGLGAMRFTKLDLSGCTNLKGLDGLKGGTLTQLDFKDGHALESLAGLKGLRITELKLVNCPKLRDLSGLKGLPLTQLTLSQCSSVADLTPLQGMPLRRLELDQCLALHDLAPLAGLNLVSIRLPPRVTHGMDGLRTMRSLQTINGHPAAAFWRDFAVAP